MRFRPLLAALTVLAIFGAGVVSFEARPAVAGGTSELMMARLDTGPHRQESTAGAAAAPGAAGGAAGTAATPAPAAHDASGAPAAPVPAHAAPGVSAEPEPSATAAPAETPAAPAGEPSGHASGVGASATAAEGGSGHAAQAHAAPPTDTEKAIHAAEHATFIDLILQAMGYRQPEEGEKDENSPLLRTIALFQMPILSAVVIFLLAALAVAGTRRREMIPGKLQNLVEMGVEGLDNFVQGILGFEGRHFVPFIGTLFLYIWVNNLIGIIPFFKSPTSSFNTTVALAICVFLYVQWTGIRRNGFFGYLFHLAGEPRDALGWGLVILLFPLHVIGELAKPMSLSLRLFGNIFGEETLIAVFVGLGVGALAALHSPVGLPLHTPFLFLALLTSTIQALVFSLLTTIYFGLMLPHHEHEEHGPEQAEGAAH